MFLFVIPNTVDEAEHHERFSTIFRNIYNLGAQLELMESRQSFYFLKSELKDFLDIKR